MAEKAKAKAKLKAQARLTRRSGWSLFLATAVISALIGVSIRLYFSPERLRFWIERAIASATVGDANFAVDFQQAQLKLANGSLPQIAVEVSHVRVTRNANCAPIGEAAPLIPALQMAKLTVPLRFTSLFTGRVAIGTLNAEDLVFDLEALKGECGGKDKLAPATKTENSAREKTSIPVAGNSPARPWWTSEQATAIRKVIEGVEFNRVTVRFEDGSKHVDLEDFEAQIAGDRLRVQSTVRVPKELTQGEPLPDFEFAADVEPSLANVNLDARLSEGRLHATAILKPAAGSQITIEAKLGLKNLPLSTLVPVLTRVAVIKREMRPKFLWLNCEASIAGQFQGLLQTSPLELSRCEVQGNGTQIHLVNAVRLPDGHWKPFRVAIESADVRQLLDMFMISGLDGIAGDLGKVHGEVAVGTERTPAEEDLSEKTDDRNSADVHAFFSGAQLKFSNRSVRAFQTIANLESRFKVFSDGRVVGEIPKIELEDGKFDGNIQFDIAKHAARGSVQVTMKQLEVSQKVQAVMLDGNLRMLSGDLRGELRDGRLEDLRGALKAESLETSDWKLETLMVQPSLARDRTVHLQMRTPEVLMKPNTPLAAATQSLSFSQLETQKGERLQDVVLKVAIPPSGGGLAWMQASAQAEKGRVKVSSEGAATRDRQLSGWVRVDFPNAKKLKWEIAGSTETPEFTFDESSGSAQLRRALSDKAMSARVLGLSTGEKARPIDPQ